MQDVKGTSAHVRRSWRGSAAVVAAAVALALAGCAASGTAGRPAADGSSSSSAGLPSGHVHGVALNPADDRVYLATHDGLFIAGSDGWQRRGPVIDLMGFSVAGADHFYSSGHPGAGTDLPNPVGLLESRDGGETWTPLSRQGQSDFHALTVHNGGVVGYDGELRVSRDGSAWSTPDNLPAAAASLAGSTDDEIVLATTESGLAISSDGGAAWSMVDGAPLLWLVDWADGENVAGLAPDGTVHVSADSGRTWNEKGRVEGKVQAIGATGDAKKLRILAVTENSVTESRDAGVTFGELQP